jgi:asparagine synthase (glutamine-hydrolysing)
MLQALSHRGPDDVGAHVSESAVLGATRLAIRGGGDGRQPMVDAASGVVVVCNGEIDNHKELRRWLADRGRPVTQATDVAVLPGSVSGTRRGVRGKTGRRLCHRRLGSARKTGLRLCANRAGERPLFFTQTADAVIFATEIASMVSKFKLPVTLDHAALQRYLRYGLFAAPASPFAGIQKIPPGGIVEIDSRGVPALVLLALEQCRIRQTKTFARRV